MKLMYRAFNLFILLFLLIACGGSGSTTSGSATTANRAPNAVNDTFTVTQSTLLNVLANDSDADNDSLTVVGITQPQNGRVVLEGNQVAFEIDASFRGNDQFTYTVQDSNGSSDTATVLLDVQPDNLPPTAVNDSATGLQNAVLILMPLSNDSDANNDVLSIADVSAPANGSIEILPGNQLRYIPNNGFVGEENITYTLSDGSLEDSATITIVLTLPDSGTNRVPLAVNDTFVVQVNQVSLLDVLVNDSDAENDDLQLIEIVGPSNGIATILNGQVSYTPNLNYLGEDSFVYIISDGNQQTAAVATIQVRTEAANNPPTARDDSAFTQPGLNVTISPFGNDSDLDGDPLSLVGISSAMNGTYSVDDNNTPTNFSDDIINYQPNPGFIGTEILVYTLTDGLSVDRAAININVHPDFVQTQLVRGSIHKGAVSGALITLYPANRNGNAILDKPIVAATSERDGLWTVRIPSAMDNIIALAQGGRFIDESDPDANILEKRVIDLGLDTILESYWFNGQSEIAISAYTSAYIRKARYETGNTDSFWATIRNNLDIAIQAMGFNPFSTIPTEPLIPSPNADVASVQYALDLGGFANAMNANAIELDLAIPTAELIDILIDDLADCELDAQFFGNTLPLVDVTNINNEIRRFRNNNILVYPNTQASIDVSTCQQDGSSNDNIAPTISLIGDNPLRLLVGDVYLEPGANAFDDVDGDLQGSLNIESNVVDTTLAGSYTVVYTVSDLSGNSTTISRSVVVVDDDPPVITLLGPASVMVEAASLYQDAGALAVDNQDGDISSQLIINNPVNINVPGLYTITYDVVDSNGNAAIQVSREVEVSDQTPPSISLLGVNPQVIEAGALYIEQNAIAQDTVDGDLSNTIIINSSAVDVTNIGRYQVLYSVSDSSGNTTQLVREVIVQDSTQPVITVLGVNPITIEAGDSYSDAGASAIDSVDGDLTTGIVVQNSVDTAVPDTYSVTYSVTDSEGNTSSVSRTVIVADTNPPVLSLVGAAPQVIEAGTLYAELGATAIDSLDGDVTSSIVTNSSSVNTLIPGTYNVTYNVSDAAGNAAVEVVRNVIVQDTQNPVITLLGNSPQVIEAGNAYLEQGATALDSLDGDITGSLVIDATTVNTNVPGDYQVTYNVVDSSNNAASELVRSVQVRDTVPPTLSILGSNPVSLLVNEAYIEFGATASDTLDGDLSSSVIVDNSGVDTTMPGNYSVTYNVRDAAGNDAIQETRVVSIVDTTAPLINLLGADPQSIEIGSTYIELGATASDNVDGDISASIVIDSSAVDPNVLGSYQVSYNVTDSSGQTAQEIIRTVLVVDTTAPIITVLGNNPTSVETGTAYIDAGATVSDAGDPSVSVSNDAATAVDTTTPGTYTVTYTATDASNNTAIATRTVIVATTTTVSIADASVNEGGVGTTDLVFTVTLDQVSTSEISVDYSVVDGTANQLDGDFAIAPPTGTITIPAGNTSGNLTVLVIGDFVLEDDETFTVVLSNPINSNLGAATAVGTILNDDMSSVSIGPVNGSASENTPTESLEYLLTIDNPVSTATTVFYSISGAGINLPNDDINELVTTSGQILIPAMQTSVTLELEVLDDNLFEGPETLSISLDGTNNDVMLSGTNTATGIINDNDTAALSIADAATVAEGNTTDPVTDIRQLDFVLSFDNPVSSNTIVTYQLEGSASSGDDYDTPPILEAVIAGSPDGVTNPTETIRIFIRKDDITEADETVNIRLLTTSNGSIVDNFATGIIENDDPPNVSLVTDNVVFLLAGSTYIDPATAVDSGGASLAITYSGDVATLGAAQTINVPGTAGGPFTRVYDVATGPSPPLERTIYIVDSLAQTDTDGDGVSDLIENAVGSDTTITNATLFVDTAATGDGTEWSNALPQLPTDYAAGASVAETSYVMIAENSILMDGLKLDTAIAACDNLAFIGSLQASTSPLEAPAQVILSNRDNPTTDFSVLSAENTVISGCQNVYFANIGFTDGTGNTLTGTGGGLDISNGAIVTIENVDVKRNTALQGGGGIAVRDSGTALDIKGSRIVNNRLLTAPSTRHGGGLYVEGAAIVSIDESSTYTDGRLEPTAISANRIEGASVQGGGIGIFGDANVDIRHAVISGNHSASDGGGIYIDTTATAQNIKIVNNLILSNGATGSGGAIAVNRVAEHRINNNTMMYNDADFAGSAYSSTNSSIQYFNNIAKDNESRSGIEDLNFASSSGLCSNNWSKQGPYNICTDTETSDTDLGLSIISSIGYYLRYTVFSRPVIDTGTLTPLPGVTDAEKFSQSGVEGRTTDSSNTNVADTVLIDMGYHYPLNDENRNADQILLLTPTIETNSNQQIRFRPMVSGEALGPKQSVFYRFRTTPVNFVDNSPSDVAVVVNPFLEDAMGNDYEYGQFTDLGDGTYILDIQTTSSGSIDIEVLSNPDASTNPTIFSGVIPICTTGVDCP